MAGDIDADVEDHKRELKEPAATLFAVQRHYGDKVREQTMGGLRPDLLKHTCLSWACLLLPCYVSMARSSPSRQPGEEREALFASFIIGIKTCEDAIAEGRYLQALALLRQEMETLAQLKAVRAGNRNESRSPNVGVLEKSLARMYGELSAAAHVAKHDFVRFCLPPGMFLAMTTWLDQWHAPISLVFDEVRCTSFVPPYT